MSEEIPESPLPVPQPYAKPILSIGCNIQLKSLQKERELKKSQTHRTHSKSVHIPESSANFDLFNHLENTKKKQPIITQKKGSIIARAKNNFKTGQQTQKIPHKEITLIRKQIYLSPKLDRLRKEFERNPNFSIFTHNF